MLSRIGCPLESGSTLVLQVVGQSRWDGDSTGKTIGLVFLSCPNTLRYPDPGLGSWSLFLFRTNKNYGVMSGVLLFYLSLLHLKDTHK